MKKKVSVIALVILSLVTACSTPVVNTQTLNTNSVSNLKLNTTISGKVVFSSFTQTNSPQPSLNVREGVDLLPSIESKRGARGEFGIKASLTDVESRATVSLIYPSDNPNNPNLIVATGLSDSNGNFLINPDSSFKPNNGETFILEATKRIGGSGNALMSLRTYVQMSVIGWKSITKQEILINVQTTALAAMTGLMIPSVTPSDSISTIDITTSNNVPSDVKHSGSTVIHASSILTVADLVSYALSKNYDPLQYIVYNNGVFSIKDPQKIVNIINTVAGSDLNSWIGDNLSATNASVGTPSSVCLDKNGNLYIADSSNYRIRKVNKITGIITTVAGNGSRGYSGDNGQATSAQLSNTSGITFDSSGNLYIADSGNYRIRKVDKITGIISTVAGNGSRRYSGDNGQATSAQISSLSGITFDLSGNLYIADSGNYRIRKVDKITGIITTVAGNGSLGYIVDNQATSAQLNYPSGITFDLSGNLYIADLVNNKIRKVDKLTGIIITVAGNGSKGYSGDNGQATSAQISNPSALTVDSSGNLYIADSGNSRIRKVDKLTGIITTVAGNGLGTFSGDNGPATSAQIYLPSGINFDLSGNLYIADSGNGRIRKIDASTGIITTIAGGGTGDNEAATAARIKTPNDITIDKLGNLYIADSDNHRIRKVNASTGIITTFAGNGSIGYSGDNGPATSAQINSPLGVTVDSTGNLYIADSVNHRIRKVDKTTGIITTVAGNGLYGYNGDNRTATSATLYTPERLTVDLSGNLYISDSRNHRIRKVDASTGIITTIAGNGLSEYSGDNGPATSASFNSEGIAVDSAGNLYIADYVYGRIRKVDKITGIITTVVAELNNPKGICFDSSENLYIADRNIIKVDKTSGIITSFAANTSSGYSGDNGPATLAQLKEPMGIVFDSSGNLYIADSYNYRIRKVINLSIKP